MAKAPLSQTVFLTEDGTSLASPAVDIPPTDVAPTPVFTAAPSIIGTPRVGQPLSALTFIEGTVANGSVIGRTYLLDGAPKPISYVLTDADIGAALVYGNTATGGVVMASSDAVTVEAVIVAPDPTAKVGQIGFNLTEDGFDQGSFAPNFYFINRLKASGYNGAWNNDAPLSQYGYPTALGSGKSDTATFLPVRRPKVGEPAIRHVIRHNGTNVDWQIAFLTGLSIVDSSDPNRIIFDVPAAPSGNENPALVVRSATVWPDYRPGNLASQRDGWACMELSLEADWLSGEIFHPQATTELAKFSFGRTMDVQRINSSPVQTLADRTSVGRCSYTSASTAFGWPLEVIVALFNKTKVMPWLCMPHGANDEYQDWFWTYVRDNLDPTIPIVAEYSNEAGWNTDFSGQYNKCVQAGQNLTPPGGPSQGYGWLAARMVARAKAVFGAQSSRLHGAFVRQRSVSDSFTQAVIGVQAAGYQLRDLFSIGSQGGYLDGGFQDSCGTTSTPKNQAKARQVYANWIATGASDATRTFSPAFANQMRHGIGLGLPNSATLDQLKDHDLWLEGFCRAQGLQHNMKYELQNFHCSAIGLGSPDGDNVNRMLSLLASDPSISGIGSGSLMREQYDFFRDHGISGCCVLTPYGAINLYGSWATKRDPFAADTGLWDFYENEQANAKQIVFDIGFKGTPTVTANEPFERYVYSYGGVFPATPITLKSGTLPGVTIANGKLTGQLAVGEYPVVFACTDATGREVTAAVTITSAVASMYRYFRVTPKGNRSLDPSNGFYRLGCAEAQFMNGSIPVAPDSWTATSPSSYGGNVPGRVCDGLTDSSFITDDGGTGRPGQFTIDTGSGGGYKPTAIRFYECPEATNFSINGVLVEVSRNNSTWTTVAELAPGAMPYTGNYATVALTYPV